MAWIRSSDKYASVATADVRVVTAATYRVDLLKPTSTSRNLAIIG